MFINKYVTILTLFIFSFTSLFASDNSRSLTERVQTLFPHISKSSERKDHFLTLTLIRAGKMIPPSFLTHYPDLSNLYFYVHAKGNGHSSHTTPSVKIPLWVEAAACKNWKVIVQLLQSCPSLVTAQYREKPFCQIIFEAAPPHAIIKQIIEIANHLDSDSHPFLGTEQNPHSLPFSHLHPSTSPAVVSLCRAETLEAVRVASHEYVFYESQSQLCARHLAAGVPFPLSLPFSSDLYSYAYSVLLHLIKEERYHGFYQYFFSLSDILSLEDRATLAARGLQTLTATESNDLSSAATLLLKAALHHCASFDDTSSLFKFISILQTTYDQEPTLQTAVPYEYVLVKEILEKHYRTLEKEIKAAETTC